MSAATVIVAIAEILGAAASLADGIGDVVLAKKVRAILSDADFPTFARRAAAAGEKAKDALDDRGRPSNE